MSTPMRTVLTGIVVFAIGLAFGVFGVDPLSAWIGTAGLILCGIGLVWLSVRALGQRRART